MCIDAIVVPAHITSILAASILLTCQWCLAAVPRANWNIVHFWGFFLFLLRQTNVDKMRKRAEPTSFAEADDNEEEQFDDDSGEDWKPEKVVRMPGRIE